MSDFVLPSVVQTRQKGERFVFPDLPVTGLLGAGAVGTSRAIRSHGYTAIVGLIISDVAGSLAVQGASQVLQGNRRVPGTWTTLDTYALTLVDGVFVAQIDSQVRADFIRLVYTNGATKQALFQPGVQLIPIYSWKRVSLDSSGGQTIVVEGVVGGTPIEVQIVDGGDPVVVQGEPGTSIIHPADVAVGAGATVPLPVPPAGTRRMSVEVTGGDADTRIRVRELGGTAGAGTLLVLLGSTMFGGADGAVAPLEVQHVAGAAATVGIRFEG